MHSSQQKKNQAVKQQEDCGLLTEILGCVAGIAITALLWKVEQSGGFGAHSEEQIRRVNGPIPKYLR